jgi:hypothetical protein
MRANLYEVDPPSSRIVIYWEWNGILERKLKKLILEKLREELLKQRMLAAVRAAMADWEAKCRGDTEFVPLGTRKARGWGSPRPRPTRRPDWPHNRHGVPQRANA